jgi:hypothetical protein
MTMSIALPPLPVNLPSKVVTTAFTASSDSKSNPANVLTEPAVSPCAAFTSSVNVVAAALHLDSDRHPITTVCPCSTNALLTA